MSVPGKASMRSIGCLNSQMTTRKEGMMMSRQSCRKERAEILPKAAFSARTNLYANSATTIAATDWRSRRKVHREEQSVTECEHSREIAHHPIGPVGDPPKTKLIRRFDEAIKKMRDGPICVGWWFAFLLRGWPTNRTGLAYVWHLLCSLVARRTASVGSGGGR